MNRRIAAALLSLSLAASAQTLNAQARALSFVRDTSYNMRAHGLTRISNVLVRADGRMLFTPEYWNGDVILLDSLFKKQSFTFKIGRRTEIAYFTQIGWVGDSVWVLDPMYRQIVFVGSNGEMAKSIGFPSWVRPFWKDRRQYPLFARMTWYAAYPDGTLLTEPSQPRHLLDTPGYDPTQRMLVRIDGDGRIVKLVARMPAMDGRFQLRSGTEKKAFTVSGYAKSHWAVSNDGQRIAVVTPISSDSGAFRVTVLNDQADTVFSRRFVVDANRFDVKRRDSLVGGYQAFGRYSAEQVRDTVRKLTPAFFSPVTSVDIGVDYSVWVTIRRPSTKTDEGEWFVVDAAGEPRGIVTLPRSTKFISRSLSRIWTQQNDRAKNSTLMIRYLPKNAIATRPSRSVRAGASSQPETPRE